MTEHDIGAPRACGSSGCAARRSGRSCAARASYVVAPRREDYGIAQLEALADGCMLVTTDAARPVRGARDLARELDPRLVGDDLAGALRTALDDPLPGLRRRARPRCWRRSRPRRSTARSPRTLLPRLARRPSRVDVGGRRARSTRSRSSGDRRRAGVQRERHDAGPDGQRVVLVVVDRRRRSRTFADASSSGSARTLGRLELLAVRRGGPRPSGRGRAAR